MTVGDASLPSRGKTTQDDSPKNGRKTHRMLPEEQIRQRFEKTPAIADWILAVRDELVSGLGEVDTLSQFARLVKEKRPGYNMNVLRLRRNASEQLTTAAKGPSSILAGHVLALVVPAHRRDEVRARFAELYAAARGEPAPFADATAHPDPVPKWSWAEVRRGSGGGW
jgi:hypothetical protein